MESLDLRVAFLVSFREPDRSWAQIVRDWLAEAGYTVRMQPWEYHGNDVLLQRLVMMGQKSPCVIPILSQDYYVSLYQERTWLEAFRHGSFKMLAVCVGRCDVEKILPVLRCLFLHQMDPATGRKALLQEAEHHAGPPDPAVKADQAALAPRPVQPPRLRSNIPYDRNPSFIGRERDLVLLESALASARRVLLTAEQPGVSGFGCTELAVEYAQRWSRMHKTTWWIRSGHPVTLAADYAALARALDLPEWNARSQPYIIQAVRRRLEQERDWLLIFDSALNEDELARYVPRSTGGTVLITSRQHGWPHVKTRQTLSALQKADAIELILQRTGQVDTRGAEAIAERMGTRPLGVALACGYIESAFVPLDEYVSLFDSQARKLWGGQAPPSDPMFTAAVALSLCGLWACSTMPQALCLMNLSAYLGTVDIHRRMLAAGAAHLPVPLARLVADPEGWGSAVSLLSKLGMVRTRGRKFAVHPFIQAQLRCWVEDAMPTADSPIPSHKECSPLAVAAPMARADWAETALMVVKDAFPSNWSQPEAWPICARLLSHGIATIRHAKRRALVSSATSEVWMLAGCYLKTREEFPQARAALENALEFEEKTHGIRHPALSGILLDLGDACKLTGDLPRARACLERAITLDRARLGPDHSAMSEDLNALGEVLQMQGEFTQAHNCYEEALAIDTRLYPKNHPAVVRDLANLGLCCLRLGDTQRAFSHLTAGMELCREPAHSEHPSWPEIMEKFACIQHALGDLASARAQIEKAVALCSAMYGPGHHELAEDLRKLAVILQDLGDIAGALTRHQQAVIMDEALYGSENPRVASEVFELGRLFETTGDTESAKTQYAKALRAFQSLFGDTHPYTKAAREHIMSLAETPPD